MSMNDLKHSLFGEVSSDSDDCLNEDTGLNETLGNINFDPGNE